MFIPVFDECMTSKRPTNLEEKCSEQSRFHGKCSEGDLAAIFATKIFVSARITSLPSPAKTMLEDVVPMKNFPSNVPSSFHTWTPSPHPA